MLSWDTGFTHVCSHICICVIYAHGSHVRLFCICIYIYTFYIYVCVCIYIHIYTGSTHVCSHSANVRYLCVSDPYVAVLVCWWYIDTYKHTHTPANVSGKAGTSFRTNLDCEQEERAHTGGNFKNSVGNQSGKTMRACRELIRCICAWLLMSNHWYMWNERKGTHRKKFEKWYANQQGECMYVFMYTYVCR